MISIITAIHNQLAMNKLFLHYLKKYTDNDFELIIIDNNSTDGSREFFEENGIKVIKNESNYSYPHCQNQGIKEAKYDNMLFLNNDVIVSNHWDTRALEIAKKHQLDVYSFFTNERRFTKEETRKVENKWKRVKHPLLFLFGTSKNNLALMLKLMYPNWQKYTENIYNTNKDHVFEGISGPAVMVTRRGLELVGEWDERIQAADFDLFLRTKERHIKNNDIAIPMVISGVYFHHYSRLSYKKAGLKRRKIVFSDADQLIPIEQKWDKDYANLLLKESEITIGN